MLLEKRRRSYLQIALAMIGSVFLLLYPLMQNMKQLVIQKAHMILP